LLDNQIVIGVVVLWVILFFVDYVVVIAMVKSKKFNYLYFVSSMALVTLAVLVYDKEIFRVFGQFIPV